MFTGIVSRIGLLESLSGRGSGLEVRVAAEPWGEPYRLGESIALDGCCLTVESFDARGFTVFASPETLRVTTLGERRIGDGVNLERAMTLGDRLGGHLVSGHVDAPGVLRSAREAGDSWELRVAAPPEILAQCIRKGSIAVDGISLTIVDLMDEDFSLWIIPETWKGTTLSRRRPGDRVNLETDQIGKYVRRFLETRLERQGDACLDEVWRNFR